MSRVQVYNGNIAPRTVYWVTDGQHCEPTVIPPAERVLIEVRGDLQGGSVTVRGGLMEADGDGTAAPLLLHTTIPTLTTVHGVTHIQVFCDVPGVTVIVRGSK